MFRPLISPLAALFCLFTSLATQAAPFTPANDSDVVERLPLSATDPSARRLQSLRKQLEAKPDDVALRIEIARRYFDLSMAQGDPRYVGYASAALEPLTRRRQRQMLDIGKSKACCSNTATILTVRWRVWTKRVWLTLNRPTLWLGALLFTWCRRITPRRRRSARL